MINTIKVESKNMFDCEMVEIEINKDLNKYNKEQILQLSRQLATGKNVYSYSIYSELCSQLGLL